MRLWRPAGLALVLSWWQVVALVAPKMQLRVWLLLRWWLWQLWQMPLRCLLQG